MTTPHKHAALIKAWADGATIQYRVSEVADWHDASTPCWHPARAYRIKPEPKPDVVFYSSIPLTGPAECDGGIAYLLFLSKRRVPGNNMKVTIDGETGQLKAAEIL